MSRQGIQLPKQKKPQPVGDDFVEFQPDNVEIELRSMPWSTRVFLYAVALMVASAICWASLAKVDRVVTTTGKLVLSSRPIVIQPIEIAVIRKFHVRIGETVKKGAPLVTLDPTMSTADLEQLQDRRDSLFIHSVRLESELNGVPFIPPPGSDKAEAQLQMAFYERRKAQYAAQINSMEKQATELVAQMRTVKASRAQTAKQLSMAREVEHMYEGLTEKGVASRLEAISAKTRVVQFESELEQKGNQLLELKEELQRTVAEKNAFVESWNSRTTEESLDSFRQLEEVEAQLEKARWLSERVTLRAPEDAIVLEMAKLSQGSVISPAERLVTLVSVDAPVLAEVEVQNRDIGYIRKGDDVRVKLEAFPFQKHGIIEGRVDTISEDAFQKEDDKSGLVVYRVRIALENTTLRAVPDDFRIMPGMQLTAEIKVGKRRVISYFLYPIIRSLDETMREP